MFTGAKNIIRATNISIFCVACLLGFSLTVQAADCHWIQSNKSDNTACQRRFGDNGKKWEQVNFCSAQKVSPLDTVCCCEKAVSKKILIIGLVTGFFAIITIGILITKNE